MLDRMFYVSGEIPRRTSFEEGMPGQFRRTVDGSGWEPDPLLMDERFVAVNVRDKGIVVFTACSHAGVVNVLQHARDCFPGVPVHAVLGGFHLSGTNERIIPQTVAAMVISTLGHSSRPLHRWRAVGALAAAFGDAVIPASVGKTYRSPEAHGCAPWLPK